MEKESLLIRMLQNIQLSSRLFCPRGIHSIRPRNRMRPLNTQRELKSESQLDISENLGEPLNAFKGGICCEQQIRIEEIIQICKIIFRIIGKIQNRRSIKLGEFKKFNADLEWFLSITVLIPDLSTHLGQSVLADCDSLKSLFLFEIKKVDTPSSALSTFFISTRNPDLLQ